MSIKHRYKNKHKIKRFKNYYRTPNWWTKEFMIVPSRAKSKQIVNNIKVGNVDPDNILLPNYKKPHIYYW